MWITSGVGRSDLAFHRSRTFRSCGPYEAFATSGGSEGLCCCCALSVNASHIKAAETGRRLRLMMDTLSQNQGLQWEFPNARPASFLKAHQDGILRIQKPVKLEHISALVGQADETILFENLCGYPDYQLIDLLFVNRKAQARVLGCEPAQVVPRLAEVLRIRARPLRQARLEFCTFRRVCIQSGV